MRPLESMPTANTSITVGPDLDLSLVTGLCHLAHLQLAAPALYLQNLRLNLNTSLYCQCALSWPWPLLMPQHKLLCVWLQMAYATTQGIVALCIWPLQLSMCTPPVPATTTAYSAPYHLTWKCCCKTQLLLQTL